MYNFLFFRISNMKNAHESFSLKNCRYDVLLSALRTYLNYTLHNFIAYNIIVIYLLLLGRETNFPKCIMFPEILYFPLRCPIIDNFSTKKNLHKYEF